MVADTPGQLTAMAVLRRNPTLAPVFTAHRMAAKAAPLALDTVGRLRAEFPDDLPEQLIGRLRETALARTVGLGAICGTSMYVAMVPAMGDVYCIQLLLTLQIGAVLGFDPHSPDRVADVLVARGNAVDLAHARRLMVEAGRLPDRRTSAEPWWQRLKSVVTSTPAVIGGKVRAMSWWQRIRLVLQVVGLLFPLLSIPLWALQYRGATIAVARRAHAVFDAARSPADPPASALEVPLAAGRTRLVLWVVVTLAVFGLIAFTVLTARTTARFRHGGLFYLVANGGLALLIGWRLRRWR